MKSHRSGGSGGEVDNTYLQSSSTFITPPAAQQPDDDSTRLGVCLPIGFIASYAMVKLATRLGRAFVWPSS